MKFDECKFIGKHEFREEITNEIILACSESIPSFEKLNIFMAEDYIHLLINESEYNIKHRFFYMKNSNIRISLKVFKSVAIEYILEHINDFLLCKYG